MDTLHTWMCMYLFIICLLPPDVSYLGVRTLPLQISVAPRVPITMSDKEHCSKSFCIPASASLWPPGIPGRAKGGSFPSHCLQRVVAPQLCLQRVVVRDQRSPLDYSAGNHGPGRKSLAGNGLSCCDPCKADKDPPWHSLRKGQVVSWDLGLLFFLTIYGSWPTGPLSFPPQDRPLPIHILLSKFKH